MRLSTKLALAVLLAVGVPLLSISLLAANSAWSPQAIAGAAVLLTVLIAALVFVLTRRLTRGLDAAVAAAESIAAGNLNVRLDENGAGETAQIAAAFNRVIDYLQELSGAADKIADGNTAIVVRPRSNEDRFGAAFQNMIERTLRLVQTQEERDRLQNSIVKLLDEVANAAHGDLTAEAEVTADATGAIADAFNYMIAELRGVIGRVKQTSLRVDDSASEIRAGVEDLRRRSEAQAAQMLELSETLEQTAAAMQRVAADTNVSAIVSDGALTNAQHGAAAARGNIAATNRLRARVEETAERLARLGERSQEIGQITKIINDLAKRSSVLALNASIQASAAGQHGRGFAAVAEEVERLAERSAQASKQIDVLTKAIQAETNEAVGAIEITVREAADSARLSGEVGGAFGEIEAIVNRLAAINQEIAKAANSQAADSTEISAEMRRVAEASHRAASEVKDSAENVNRLADWAQELRQSIASFRLPDNAQAA